MPIYEYVCNGCTHQFETLVSASMTPECPACQSQALTKQLSVFAVSDGGGAKMSAAPAGCGSCGDPRGPGACKLPN